MPIISYPLQNENREIVRQLIEAFVKVWPLSDSGPAHIALADYNLLDDNLDFCLGIINRLIGLNLRNDEKTEEYRDTYKDHSRDELMATEMFLRSLRYIPETWRDIHAESVEDE